MGGVLWFVCVAGVSSKPATLGEFSVDVVNTEAVQAAASGGEDDVGSMEQGKADVVEELGDFEVVEQPPVGISVWDVIGRLHPMTVHFPIAWILLLMLLEGAGIRWPLPESNRWGLYLGLVALLAFAPAVATGLLRFAHMEGSASWDETAVRHRNIMFASGLALAGAVTLRLLGPRSVSQGARVVRVALTLLAAALVSVGSHVGGKLVYGEMHLPF